MGRNQKQYFFLPGALICVSFVLLVGALAYLISGDEDSGLVGVVYGLLVWVAADYGMRRAKEKEDGA